MTFAIKDPFSQAVAQECQKPLEKRLHTIVFTTIHTAFRAETESYALLQTLHKRALVEFRIMTPMWQFIE